MKLESLDNLITIISGYAFKSTLFNEIGDGLPLIRVRDINSKFAGMYYSGDYDDIFIINDGDLLISLDGDFKCIEWSNGIALLNQRVCKIIPKSNLISRDYLLYFLPSILNEIHRNTNFTTVKHLSVKKIKEIKIPLPETLEDQIYIATVLSQAEKLIKNRNDSIDLLDEFVKSIFYKMFGDPIKNEKKWGKVMLSKLGSLDRGVSKNRPRNTPELLGGKYPLIQTGEVSNSGLFIKEFKNTYSELGLKQSKLWDEGTMLITIAANIAQTSILSFKACFPDSIVGFISDKKESNVIYVHHLLSFFQKKLEYDAPSSAQKNINLKILRELKVPKPPLKLQNQFATIVEKNEILKNQFKESLDELENLFGALSQKAFKGELTLNDGKIKIKKPIESFEQIVTPQMQEFINKTNVLSKLIPKVPASITLPSSFEKISKQIEQITKMLAPFEKIPKLPETVIESLKSFENLKAISSKLQIVEKSTWSETKNYYGEVSGIEFSNIEGLAIFDEQFNKENKHFTYAEFEGFLKNEKIEYKYKDVKNFIFNLLDEKRIEQIVITDRDKNELGNSYANEYNLNFNTIYFKPKKEIIK